MNLTHLPSAIAVREAAGFLVDCLGRGAVILAVAWFVARVLRGRSAALRHHVWAVGLASLLLLPAAILTTPEWTPTLIDRVPSARPDPARPTSTQARTAPSSGISGARSRPIEAAGPIGSPAPAPAQRSSGCKRIPGAFLLVWGVGVLAGVASLVARRVGAAWLARTAVPLTTRSGMAARRSIARAHGLGNAIDVRTSPRIRVPFIAGLRRPIVLVPAEAVRWPGERLAAMLHHEAAHLERRDHLTLALAQIARAVHWMDPLVWFAARRLAETREHATDDAVLAAGVAPIDYARALLCVASGVEFPAAAHPAMANQSGIRRRIEDVLDSDPKRKGDTLMLRLSMTAILLCTTVALSAIELRAAPDDELFCRLEAVAQTVRASGWDSARPDFPEDLAHRGAVAGLIDALSTTDSTVRRIAAWALGEIGDPRAIDALIVALSDPATSVRSSAAHALGDIRDPRARGALRAAAEDDARQVRAQASWALREIAEEELRSAQLTQALRHHDPEVRLLAAHAMGDRRDPADVEALVQALGDSDTAVRAKVAWALGEIRGVRLRSQAAGALGDVGDPAAAGALRDALSDESRSVRENARKALDRIEG